MSSESESGFFFIKRPEVALGRVLITSDGPHPYKVVFQLGERVLSEHPVPTVRDGEALIRREIASIQFTSQEERPRPDAPPKREGLSAVE